MKKNKKQNKNKIETKKNKLWFSKKKTENGKLKNKFQLFFFKCQHVK